MKGLYTLLLLFALSFHSYAQRCVTEEVRESMNLESVEQFESWMQQKRAERRTPSLLRTETVVQIPVVVHIIHNGEPLGTGINITDDQILSQIQVINEDYRRLNPDAGDTHAEFLPVAADFEIEFVLAKQDPEGLATSGIERVDGGRASWSWSEQSVMKSLSYWPTEDYLNIWVSDLTGTNGSNVLGFAQYPVTTLPGLDAGGKQRLVDGVAIDYTVFGSEVYYPAGNYNNSYDRGRTLTHELGHFFGLRHIWGDGFSCGATDYCDDTPQQLSSTVSCPSSQTTCSTNDMFQNYMDYTNDACMNIFTEDQKSRVRTVIMESPRRVSLTTSHGLLTPVQYTNDAGILAINTPGSLQCEGIFTPAIQVKNYGSATLNTIEIKLSIDGLEMETVSPTPNLSYLESTSVTFSAIAALSGSYTFEIVSTNGVTDENALSNLRQLDVRVPVTGTTPLLETFESNPADWIIINPDNDVTWLTAPAPFVDQSNRALLLENYYYEAPGELDYLVSPVFDLSTATTPFLHFDVAYAPYPGEDQDALAVGVITGCDLRLSTLDTVYFKDAVSLATSGEITSYFTPINPSDWRNEGFISLENYKGQSQVQLVFISQAGYGNNLYIDNISVTAVTGLDLELTDVLSPGRYACDTDFNPTFSITNRGTESVNSFTLSYAINGGAAVQKVFSGLNIPPGANFTAAGDPVVLMDGFHSLTAEVTMPNNDTDSFTSNNSAFFEFGINDTVISPPDRQLFADGDLNDWYSWSSNSSLNGSIVGENFKIQGFGSSVPSGTESWLISPVFDFSGIEEASLFFDLAYSLIPDGSEELYLMVSTDCGSTYTNSLYQVGGQGLATAAPQTDFTPAAGDWRREFVLLNSVAGESTVRFALRSIYGGGNNLYLDNIELFIGDDFNPVTINDKISHVYPNPTFNGKAMLTLNLEEKEELMLHVFDRLGRRVLEKQLSDVLNQTYEIDLSEEPLGIYIVQVVGKSVRESFRLMVAR